MLERIQFCAAVWSFEVCHHAALKICCEKAHIKTLLQNKSNLRRFRLGNFNNRKITVMYTYKPFTNIM